MSAGERDLAWKAEKALAASVLSPHHTLESLGEYFKLNTSLVLTFQSLIYLVGAKGFAVILMYTQG